MKESEFFQRAATDAAFRRAQLDDLHYLKQVGAGGIWFCAGLGAAASLYGGLAEGKWDLGFGLLVVGLFWASRYSFCATRLAALQAIEDLKAQE